MSRPSLPTMQTHTLRTEPLFAHFEKRRVASTPACDLSLLCRPKCWFKRLPVRKRLGFPQYDRDSLASCTVTEILIRFLHERGNVCGDLRRVLSIDCMGSRRIMAHPISCPLSHRVGIDCIVHDRCSRNDREHRDGHF